MSKKQDRLMVVQQIHTAADLYRKNLVGKKFLYVFDGRYIEVIYKAENFRHLTGVDTNLSAKDFYSKAARRMLTVKQINFTSQHPYDLCVRKLQHLSHVSTIITTKSFILEEITTVTCTYKFGTTDLKFSLCMNKDTNGDCYVAQSLRDEDCSAKSKTVYGVAYIFSKSNDSKKYSKLLFCDSGMPANSLPDEVFSMLVEPLQQRLLTLADNESEELLKPMEDE